MVTQPEENQPQEATPAKTEAPGPAKAGNKNVLIIVIVVVLAVLGMLVYSYTAKKFIFTKSGKIDGVNYKTNGKETTLSDKDGALTVGDDVTLPKDFPKDIPVHPKGKIVLVTSKSADATWISQEIKDSKQNIMNWYKSESQKKGWKIWDEQPELLTLANENYGASVSLTEDSGKIIAQFSTMKLDAVKTLTGIDPNKTTSEELQKSILDGTYQPSIDTGSDAEPEE